MSAKWVKQRVNEYPRVKQIESVANSDRRVSYRHNIRYSGQPRTWNIFETISLSLDLDLDLDLDLSLDRSISRYPSPICIALFTFYTGFLPIGRLNNIVNDKQNNVTHIHTHCFISKTFSVNLQSLNDGVNKCAPHTIVKSYWRLYL